MAGLKVGRKKMRPEEKRVNVTVSVSPLARQVMNQLLDMGYSLSKEFDTLVLKLGKKENLIDRSGRLIPQPENNEE